jgi:hypothetical protein
MESAVKRVLADLESSEPNRWRWQDIEILKRTLAYEGEVEGEVERERG